MPGMVGGGLVSNGGTEAYVRIKEKRPARFGGRGGGGGGDKGTTTIRAMPAEHTRQDEYIQTITWRV